MGKRPTRTIAGRRTATRTRTGTSAKARSREAVARRRVLEVLFVASEAGPFAKTGGLADVAGALPRSLARLGHRVTLVTPRYRGIECQGAPVDRMTIDLAARPRETAFYEQSLGDGVRAVLVDCPEFFDREGPYGQGDEDYPDNAQRFAHFSRAALEFAARHLGPLAIVHANDWQTGLVPVYLRTRLGAQASLARAAAVFTVHNLAFQGLFAPELLPGLGLGWDLFTLEGLEYWGKVSFLKGGINFSDFLTTVSPRYAQEILTPELGFGFDGILRARRDCLVGILNGIDADRWNPAADPFLPAPFGSEDLTGKRKAKGELLRAFGLPANREAVGRPVVGMISRLVDQKGLDLLAQCAEELPGLEAGFVVLGTGEPRYEAMWRTLATRYPDRIGVYIGFDERRAHLVEAGADMFLMPSRFEPCGLNQMYSFRYGTVPIVRATGGLADTVQDYDERSGRGTGFVFVDYTPESLFEGLERALRVFGRRAAWQRLMKAGMGRDHSWDVSAREYVKVYRRALSGQGSRKWAAPGGRA